MQFHPEVYHTKDGFQILKNFLVDISKIPQEWTPNAFVESTVKGLYRKKVLNEKLIFHLNTYNLIHSKGQFEFLVKQRIIGKQI